MARWAQSVVVIQHSQGAGQRHTFPVNNLISAALIMRCETDGVDKQNGLLHADITIGDSWYILT